MTRMRCDVPDGFTRAMSGATSSAPPSATAGPRATSNAASDAAARNVESPGRRRLLARLAFLTPCAGAIAASGCGFKLRGPTPLPYPTLHVAFPPAAASTVAEFRRQLRVSEGTRIVDRARDADAVLHVVSEVREKEIVGFSSTGRPREYQLRLRITFRLVERDETERIPQTEIVLRREVTTTDTQLVAKEQEEALLYRDMQSDAVQQLMRRIAAVRR